MIVTVHKQTADGEIENSDIVQLDDAKNHRNGEATRDKEKRFQTGPYRRLITKSLGSASMHADTLAMDFFCYECGVPL